MSDGKRTDFVIPDMVVIVLTEKLWEECSLFSLDIKKRYCFEIDDKIQCQGLVLGALP